MSRYATVTGDNRDIPIDRVVKLPLGVFARQIMTQGQFQQSTGAQTGQQYGQTQGGMSQGGSQQQPGQPQQLAESIARAIDVCGWCADQCIQESNPQMVECIQLCEDVTEIGEAAIALLPKNSRFAGSILQTFQQAVQACAKECGQHDRSHCQECAQVLGQTMQEIQQGMGTTQGAGGGMGGGGMGGGGMTQGF